MVGTLENTTVELKLSVPPFSTRVLTDVEMRPAKIKAWLAGLPLLNVPDTSRTLFSSLSTHNRIDSNPVARFELLELYRENVKNMSAEMEKLYLGLPLPLTDKQKTLAEQHRQFHLEMAIGYKRVVLGLRDHDREGWSEDAFRRLQATAVQRAILYLTQALAISYQSYSPYPLGTWSEIHTLYRYAEQLALADVAVRDALNATVSASSIAHTYKQALLLDLSDPYHQPARMINRIHHYLDRWASLARLLPATGAFDPACQFLIDPNADHSGIAYSADTALANPEHHKLLNTVELARKIHTHVMALQEGHPIEPEGLDPGFFADPVTPVLLRRLIQTFGLHPKRVFRRNVQRGKHADLVTGLPAMHYWINGGSRFFVSSTFVGPMPQRTQFGAAGLNPAAKPEAPTSEFDFTVWEISDESAGGVALEKKGLINARLRVGEIAAVRDDEQKRWRVGIVRWLKSASPSNIEVGTQWLAPNAEPVVVKTMNDEGAESDFLPALLLPEIPALKQPRTLVTHRGVYKPRREIYFDDGFRLHKIRLTKPVEVSHAFERFQYEVVA
jgi:hypothetical protein